MSDTQDDDVQRYDFTCATNEDFSRLLAIKKTSDGSAQSITGWSGYLSIYESDDAKEAGNDPLFALSPAGGISVYDQSGGIFLVSITRDAIRAKVTVTGEAHAGHLLPRKTCVYDFIAVDSSGVKMRQMAGNFYFELGRTAGP